MSDEHERPNAEAHAVPEVSEDLEPTRETAAEITGGDATPAAMVSNVTKAYEEPAKSVAANMR